MQFIAHGTHSIEPLFIVGPAPDAFGRANELDLKFVYAEGVRRAFDNAALDLREANDIERAAIALFPTWTVIERSFFSGAEYASFERHQATAARVRRTILAQDVLIH